MVLDELAGTYVLVTVTAWRVAAEVQSVFNSIRAPPAGIPQVQKQTPFLKRETHPAHNENGK